MCLPQPRCVRCACCCCLVGQQVSRDGAAQLGAAKLQGGAGRGGGCSEPGCARAGTHTALLRMIKLARRNSTAPAACAMCNHR